MGYQCRLTFELPLVTCRNQALYILCKIDHFQKNNKIYYRPLKNLKLSANIDRYLKRVFQKVLTFEMLYKLEKKMLKRGR